MSARAHERTKHVLYMLQLIYLSLYTVELFRGSSLMSLELMNSQVLLKLRDHVWFCGHDRKEVANKLLCTT